MQIGKTNWFSKFTECLLVALAFLNTASMILEFLPKAWLANLDESFDTIFFSIEYGIALLFGIGYSIYWHRKEKRLPNTSGKKHAWMLGIIRYWLAFEISSYGFAKILGTQFHTPGYRKDMLLGEANGFTLTWYYYGYSYALAVIIACTQIGGSILLLFRRTVLLGAIILLPVLINILLINAFFDIASGAYSNSILFTIALLFLFALHWQIVKKVFVELRDGLPKIRLGFFKPILKLLPILCAFLMIEYYLKANDADTKLIGTWQVKQMIRNKDTLTTNSWLTDSSSFKKVYFDGRYGCAFSPNPYRYKSKESKRGSYTYDTIKHALQISFYGNTGKADTMNAEITIYSKDSMLLKGRLLKDSVEMILKKQK